MWPGFASTTEGTTDGNDLAASFILDTHWDNLPTEVQHKARQALLDALGATLVGTLAPISRIVAGYARSAFGGDEATILLHGARATAAGAAFANGCAGWPLPKKWGPAAGTCWQP
jgi:2-methylcitrate dehydratase PrpD